MLFNGHGIPRDARRAVRLFRTAATDYRIASAMFMLYQLSGCLPAPNLGIPAGARMVARDEANEMLRRAASLNFQPALNAIAQRRSEGVLQICTVDWRRTFSPPEEE